MALDKSDCAPCGIGQVWQADFDHITVCITCNEQIPFSVSRDGIVCVSKRGYYTDYEDGEHVCSPCQPGTFTNVTGDIACGICSYNAITIDRGATECKQCPQGQYWYDVITCQTCAPGTFLSQNNTECLACTTIHQDYCSDMSVEIQEMPWDEQDKISFTSTCKNQQFSMSTATLCKRCGCSLFQDALTPANANAISCDNTL